ncbi:hypothetical protein [Burkholderia cepacia]|uniref:hypothetical protein n=1 Tax=Burkholderia cepacia TaxID=292 RepID=UPI001CF21813|nr:hypothetical protein [Burkholderia cepacia]MCA8361655.1 hypothetical protein [Burkholderia cepacia]
MLFPKKRCRSADRQRFFVDACLVRGRAARTRSAPSNSAACNIVSTIEYRKYDNTEGPPMKNTVRIPISVLALMLAAPAFANTPADNVAWSARPLHAAASTSACSAYSGRVMSGGESPSTENVLKALGTSLAGAVLGAVTGGYQGAVSNPCPRPGL